MEVVVGAADGLLLLGEDPLPPLLALYTPHPPILSLPINKLISVVNVLLVMEVVVGANDGLFLLGEDPLPPLLALHTPHPPSHSLSLYTNKNLL
jgi:hypothetical protein